MNSLKMMLIVILAGLLPLMAQVKVGDIAPDFSGYNVDNKYFSLSQTSKDSLVVIFFMGYSCSICKGNAPGVENNIHRIYLQDGVRVVGLDVWDGSITALKSGFIVPTNSTYSFLPKASAIGLQYGLGVHSFVIIGTDMRVKYVSTFYNEQGLKNELDILLTSSSAEDRPKGVPLAYHLEQNYPNPFNPSTQINFEVKVDFGAIAELNVYDVLGNRVKQLYSAQVRSGYYNVEWDGTTERGELAPSGVYFYTLRLSDRIETRRMLLVR